MPTDLKKARVAPVYKRDKTAHKRNYRPFSVRQDFSKKKKKKKSGAFFSSIQTPVKFVKLLIKVSLVSSQENTRLVLLSVLLAI